MYADQLHRGYARPGLKPGNLAIAVALNGGIFAALLLATPAIEQHTDKPFVTRNIPLDPPPPPRPEPKPDLAKVKPANPVQQPPLHVPDPVVETPSKQDFIVASIPEPAYPPANPGTGSEVAPRVEPAPPPLPVLVGPEIDPRYADAFQPTYPGEERRAGRAGTVTVRVLIGVDGRVKQVERVASASDAFFAATRDRALARWRFRPATRGGVPAEAWRTFTVRFVLSEG